MAIANTSLVHKAYQMLFTSLPCGKAMHWLERNVFEAWMGVSTVVLYVDIECKCYIQMYIRIDA